MAPGRVGAAEPRWAQWWSPASHAASHRPVSAAYGGVGAAVVLWLLPWHQPAVTTALIVAAACMFLPAVTAPAVALLTLRPPEHPRPHVLPVFGAAVFVASPIAYAAAGVPFEHLSVGTVLAAVAAGATVCALVLVNLNRSQRARGVTRPDS